MDIIEKIWDFLKGVWNFIKKIIVQILNFFKNIIAFFKEPARLRKIQQDKNIIAVSIKKKLESGEYNVVNCLYNTETEELVDYEEDALVIEAKELDVQTQEYFGDKDMIILR